MPHFRDIAASSLGAAIGCALAGGSIKVVFVASVLAPFMYMVGFYMGRID